jgi:hypothetical protein
MSLLAVLSIATSFGQGLSLSSGVGSPSGATAVVISLTSPAGSAPAGLQWTLSYNPADIAAISVAPGASALAAAKSVNCSSAVGAHTCLAIGMNGNAVPNGSVAIVNVTLTASAVTTVLRLTNTLASSGSGNLLPLSGASGTITIQSTAGGAVPGGATGSGSPSGSSTAFSAIRVNAGGPAFTDDAGQVWTADRGFSGGNVFAVKSPVAGTKNQALYQTLRWQAGTFQYQFAVPNGVYTVNLKFAEVYFARAGQRRFSVIINGQTALFNFDIVSAAGGPGIAIDRSFQTTVTNGAIVIQFARGDADDPQINAIEIVATGAVTVALTPSAATLGRAQSQQFTAGVKGSANSAVTWSLSAPLGTVSGSGLYTAPSVIAVDQQITLVARSVADSSATASATVNLVVPQPGFTPIRVNAGGPAYTDPKGQRWSADTGATNGEAWGTDVVVGNTSTPELYKTKRWDWDRLGYRFTVPNGTYTVTLKFAEIWFKNPGQRVFDVTINGQKALANFDIVAQAGGPNRAVDKTVTVNVTNGVIAIEMNSTIDEPQINAIEILQ